MLPEEHLDSFIKEVRAFEPTPEVIATLKAMIGTRITKAYPGVVWSLVESEGIDLAIFIDILWPPVRDGADDEFTLTRYLDVRVLNESQRSDLDKMIDHDWVREPDNPLYVETISLMKERVLTVRTREETGEKLGWVEDPDMISPGIEDQCDVRPLDLDVGLVFHCGDREVVVLAARGFSVAEVSIVSDFNEINTFSRRLELHALP